jgi:gliding motility-associated-like protein
MKNKLLFFVLTSLFAVVFTTGSQAQSTTITLDYDGAQVLGCCDVCGDDYICFGGGCGCCIGTGTLNFADPVPPGNTITGVNIVYWGVDCGSAAISISSTINGTNVGTTTPSFIDCWCSNCYSYGPGTATTFPCTGVGGYNYGGMNTLQPAPTDIVCMDQVDITFDYVPNSSFALPSIGAVSGPASGCSGTTGTYTVPLVPGATTYTWTVPGGTSITSGQGTNTINVTYGATTGNICVTATSACDSEGPVCMNVTMGGAPTVNDPADQTVCAGTMTAAVNFVGTGTGYDWINSNPGIGLGGSGSGNIPPFTATNITGAAITGTITVTPTGGCAGTPQTFTITVNPTPTVTDPADQVVCEGANTTAVNFVGPVPGTTFPWTNSQPSIGLAASGTGNIGAFAGINGTGAPVVGTVTVTPTLGTCTGPVQTFTYTINPNPSFSLAFTDPSACAVPDGTITISNLSASTNYDVTYTDGAPVGPTTMTSDGAGNIVISGLDAGGYSNFQVSLGGCTGTVPSTITLTDPTPPTVGAGADQAVCAGSSAVLMASNPDGAIISWDNGVLDGVPFTPGSTTTYTVTADLAGCIANDQVVVTVNPMPVVGAGADQSVCTGSSVTLTANNPNGAVITWNNGVTDGVPFTPAATLTYTVTATLAGCVSTDAMVLTVNPLPNVTANASPAANLCIGDNVTLNGGGAIGYSWTGGVSNGVPFTATTTTTYTVTGTDALGCTNTANITLTVVNCALPVAAIGTGGSPATICVNACVNFQDLSTGTNIDTWQWDLGFGGVTSSVQNPTTMCYGVPGVYTITLTVTDDVGSDSETFTLTVIECIPPTAEFTLSDSVICLGECITLTDQSLEDPTSWEWAFDGALTPNTSTLQSPVICPTATGTFDIELTVTNPFGVDVISYPITVNVVPVVNAGLDTTIEMHTWAELDADASPAGGTYSWTFNDGEDWVDDDIDCPSCDSTLAWPVFTETYQVIYVTPEGCSAMDEVLITVLFEDLIDVPNGFSPNGDHNNEILFVKGDGIIDMQFVIYNRYGQKVFESYDQSIGWDGYLNGQAENPGVFVWYLDYTLVDGSRNSKKGNVTLIK